MTMSPTQRQELRDFAHHLHDLADEVQNPVEQDGVRVIARMAARMSSDTTLAILFCSIARQHDI